MSGLLETRIKKTADLICGYIYVCIQQVLTYVCYTCILKYSFENFVVLHLVSSAILCCCFLNVDISEKDHLCPCLTCRYEVKFQDGQECGGAYIKLLSHQDKLDLVN